MNIEKEMERRRKEHVAAIEKQRTEKTKRTAAALAAINKKFGASTIGPLAGSRAANLECMLTGFPRLDDLLTGETNAENETKIDTGLGLPRGRIIEIFGNEASGKTTLTLHFIAAAQKLGYVCAFIDAEHALHAGYARKLGVKLDELLITQPNSAEEAFDTAIELCDKKAVDMIVTDSVSALEPQAEDDEDMAKASVALQARLMSKGLRKLTHHVSDANVIKIFTNQMRKKIGVMFGNPNTTSGGNALKFYASIRLATTRVKTLKQGDIKHGIRTKIYTEKNKCAPPFREIYVDILHNRGIVTEYGEEAVPGGKGGKAAKENDDE